MVGTHAFGWSAGYRFWTDGEKPIRGVIDGENMMGTALNKRPLVCLPVGVTLGQVEDVVVKYLKDNPAERNKPFAGLIGVAAATSWPCSQ
jgi:hypothetical protein